MAVIGRGADVDPCAVDGKIYHAPAVGNSLFDKVGGIGASLSRNGVEQLVGNDIDARVGIVGVGGFLLQGCHPRPVGRQNRVGDRHVVGDGGYGDVGLFGNVAQIHFFKRYCGQQVAVHHHRVAACGVGD